MAPPVVGASATSAGEARAPVRWHLVAVVGVVALGTALVSRTFSIDAFFALSFGRFIAHHGLPHHNVFTAASPGQVWIDQQWLSHLAFYGMWVLGGYRAVALMSVSLVTAGFTVLLLVMVRNGVAARRAMWWTLLAYAGCFANTAVRPQSFGFLLFPVVIGLLLDDARALRASRRTLLMLAVLVVWANLHGSVLVGAALVSVYAVHRSASALRRSDGESALAYAGLSVAAVAAAVITPYGRAEIHDYMSSLGPAPWKHDVADWAAPSLGNPFCWGFLVVALVVGAAVAFAWWRLRRLPVVPALLSLATFALAMTGIRFGIWFCMVAPVAAALATEPMLKQRRPASSPILPVLLAFSSVAALLAVTVLLVTSNARFEGHAPRRALDAAAATLAAHPGERLLADEFSGTSALWFYPSLQGRVAYDLRFGQYRDEDVAAFFDLLEVRGPRWDRALEAYDVVTVDRRQHPALASALLQRPGWHVVYADAQGITVEHGNP